MIRGSVKGQAELRRVQGIITATPAQIQTDVAAGVRKVMKTVQPGVKAEADVRLPQRGGYAALMAAAVKAATSVRTSGNKINATATVSAQGRRENRDVSAVNRGIVRHPLWGNRDRWFTTRTRPLFVTVVIDRTRDSIVDVVKDARDEAARKIARG